MAYLNLDLDYFDHPKTKRLVGVLGRGADVLPIRLWCYCGKYHAENGHLNDYSPTDLETLIGWWGQPGRALEAMLQPFMEKPGFLERTENGFKVHDWEKINGHIWALKERASTAAEERWKKYRDAKAMLKHSSSNALSNTLSSPILTLPSNTPPTPSRGKQKRERKRFEKPTVEEIAAYCAERMNGISPQAFFDSNEQKGWVVGKNRTPMVDWKAAIRTWEHNRAREGSSSVGRKKVPVA